jgi:hypothetical protein
MVSMEFFIDIILPASNRNEYYEYSIWGGRGGGKGGRCVGLTTSPPSGADFLEILNPHALSRPVQGLFYLCYRWHYRILSASLITTFHSTLTVH